jgi:dihydrofolate reductase
VFNNATLDGYFTSANGDMSWAHKQDPEWVAFTTENAGGGGVLLFGRKTYDFDGELLAYADGHEQ